MKTCPGCGTGNPDARTSCANCNRPLSDETTGPVGAMAPGPVTLEGFDSGPIVTAGPIDLLTTAPPAPPVAPPPTPQPAAPPAPAPKPAAPVPRGEVPPPSAATPKPAAPKPAAAPMPAPAQSAPPPPHVPRPLASAPYVDTSKPNPIFTIAVIISAVSLLCMGSFSIIALVMALIAKPNTIAERQQRTVAIVLSLIGLLIPLVALLRMG